MDSQKQLPWHWFVLVACGLVWGLYWRTYYFADPFIDLHLGTGASHIGTFVRNLFRYGFIATRGAPVESQDIVSQDAFQYALNHLPLTHHFYAPAWALFPGKEWALRGTGLGLAIISWFSVYRLARRTTKGPRLAWITLLVGAIIPMGSYYDGQVDPQGPDVLAVSILMLLAYVRWLEKPHALRFMCVVVMFLIGAITEWPAYYMGGMIILDLLLYRDGPRPIVKALGMMALAISMFALYVLYLGWVKGGGGFESGLDILKNGASKRSTLTLPSLIEGARQTDINPEALALFRRLVTLTMNKVVLLLTAPGMILGGLALLWALIQAIRRRATRSDRTFMMLFGFGLSHVILFIPGALNHDYWWKYALPGLSWGIALCIVQASDIGHSLGRRIGRPKLIGNSMAYAAFGLVAYASISGTPQIFALVFEAPYERGKAINELTESGEVTLLSDITAFPETNYYSDRVIVPRITSPAQFIEALGVHGDKAVLYSLHDPAPNPKLMALLIYLRSQYREFQVPGKITGRPYTFFDLSPE